MLKKYKTEVYIAIILAVFFFLKNRKSKLNASYEQGEEAVVATEDDYFASGGGSGFQPTGEDSTTSQGGDPTSPIETSKPDTGGETPIPDLGGGVSTGGPTPIPNTKSSSSSSGNSAPLVGDIASGVSGRPAVGRPVAPTLSRRRNSSRPFMALTR
jgi:hypothetical protein